MNPLLLTLREITHRWMSSSLIVLVVMTITATLGYFSVNSSGYKKEITRNTRDIGSNVVILPASVDQFQYHSNGGISDQTMSENVVQQLIQYKASLNHLIPMLERMGECSVNDRQVIARIVGISASIPMPGRPKSPMQKMLNGGKGQLGSLLAEELSISREESVSVLINGRSFLVDRVNRSNGTWQDSSVFLDLAEAQSLFGMRGQVSRIEAIECTSEKCEEFGVQSEVVLMNELAAITDQAAILRRDRMAIARVSIRKISQDNLQLMQNVLWSLLAMAMIGLSALNSIQRTAEVGILQALGFGPGKILCVFLLRSILLAVVGVFLGIVLGCGTAFFQAQDLFTATGKKLRFDWNSATMISVVAIMLSVIASSIPALIASRRDPASVMGKEY